MTARLDWDQSEVAVLERILAGRHSCRAFLPTPVPRAHLEQILELAQQTASWCNSQPWHVLLLSGAATSRLAAALLAADGTVPRVPDLDPPRTYRGVYQDRRRASGFALYDSLGIARADRERRERQRKENLRFFGAPHTAIITTEAELGPYGAVDCGGYVSTLLLAARSLGIDSIAQASIAMAANVVRDSLALPEHRQVVCAVSLGYSDQRHPANAFRTGRARLADAVTWMEE